MSELRLNPVPLLGADLENLVPFFQPIVEVSSGMVTGYEALARIVEPNGRVTSAGGLFSSSELSSDEKRRLDRCVREKAIQRIQDLPEHTRMTLNISPQWLTLGHSLPTLTMLSKHNVTPNRVVIELTELSGDLASISLAVAKYREHDIRIAIDDFGAGFSQFDRVVALEPDVIKLDMQLFKQAAQGGIAESVVESLAYLCAKSGAVIVCEGVETEQEFFFGLRCGARHMQGFLFSQATADFVDKEAFVHQVTDLRKRFFAEQQAKCLIQRDHQARLVNAVKAIQQHHADAIFLDIDFVSAALSDLGDVIRFYGADLLGDQTTANYTRSNTSIVWLKDDAFLGCNWSWRPYFYQLAGDQSRVLSQPYLDLETARLCKTMSVKINKNIVLLLDIEVA